MKVWHNLCSKLITKQNIFRGFQEFLKGKRTKKDVIGFGEDKENNLKELQKKLENKTYLPGGYSQFFVHDRKPRTIHKASVIDRIVHHIVSDILEKIFEPTFIHHSYACRKDKGTHRGVLALQKMAIKESLNNTRICWVLKCDIKKFFAGVNHEILLKIFAERIKDQDFLNLLGKIITSFHSDKTRDPANKKGIPIGNLTSQFFSNVYMNEFDQYIKHKLKVKYYLRYADDFAFISHDKTYLLNLIEPIRKFLIQELDLELHPKKIIFGKFSSGIDFLGYIVFPKHILPRTKTKRRLLKKIKEKIEQFKSGKITEESLNQTIQSYYGFLVHANSYKFKQELQNSILFWLTE